MLYPPLYTLKPFGENIWIVDGDTIEMSMYGMKVPFSTRMTIIKLENNQLWCHSPIKLTETLEKEINNLGEVTHLISPNKIHYAYIQSWKEVYPNAIAWASPGVRQRAKNQQIMVEFEQDLQDQVPFQWENIIDQIIFRGSFIIEEVCFFHRQSSTLILTDFIENFELSKVPDSLQKLVKISGSVDPDGKTPLDLRLTFLFGKKQGYNCLQKILQWQPEKIILAHGRCYQENATAELRRAFRWLGQ
jgi:hypothetical protein